LKKKIKINETLILYFVIIGFISITSVSALTYYQYRKAILERSFEQLKAIRNLKKRKIEEFFGDRIRDIQFLSQSTEVRHIVTNLKNNDLNQLDEESYIYKYVSSSNYYSSIMFSDSQTTLFQPLAPMHIIPEDTYKTNRIKLINALLEKDNGPVLIDFLSDKKEMPFITIATKIYKNKNQPEIIALEIPLEAINSIVLESISNIGFGESGESYLVGNDFLMRSNSRFMHNSVLNVEVHTEAAKKAFTDNEGTMITKDYRGINVLSSFCKIQIKNLDWILLSEIDLKEVMKPVYKLRNQLLFLSILLIIIVFIIGWFLSSKIAAPIIRIKEAALKISEGNFPMVDTESNNEEINELLKTFNYMSAQLKEKKEQLKAEQLKHFSAVIDGQESERKRLSYELHDGLGQTLVALKYKIESLQQQDVALYQNELKILEQSVAEAIEEVRRISFNLMPAVLTAFGLIPALQNMCNKLASQTKNNIVFESDGKFDLLNEKQNNYLFRIAQELLNNALKHAHADLISLQLIEFPKFYMLIAEDNGKGFDYNTHIPINGNGLYSIKERVDILKGKVIIQSVLNEGTVIRVKIPK